MIYNNLRKIEENIIEACNKAGRNRDEVTLIAVSKTQPIDLIEEALEAGIVNFGENKVQELVSKIEVLNEDKHKDLKWHMIGHLQRNKVKYIVDKVSLIHSVDSIRLAKQIEKEARKRGVTVDVLIEVNIAGDPDKFGFKEEEVYSATLEISRLEHINIKGLMTVAPYVTDPEENRLYFSKMKQLSVDIKAKNIDNVIMDTLSMGMTGDYTVAIEEGATMVRIGTGIFGERDYSL
ncbi:MAG: YggS family pyridoxal phosphate-dependent enzyme [Clostridiales bacterium]|nr:YggS family pyridoxal phosphate-dependent enzyme [Clostridiales bacterium]